MQTIFPSTGVLTAVAGLLGALLLPCWHAGAWSVTTKRRGDGPAPADRRAEVRLPATAATLVAIALLTTLPSDLLGVARYVGCGVLVALLVPLLRANPVRMTRHNRRLRQASLGFAGLLLLADTAGFVILVHALLASNSASSGSLLLAALQVWLANLIGCGLFYWELDRGGPVVRATAERDQLPPADWQFPQDATGGTTHEVARGTAAESDWRPRFVDYLYVSATNSTAFSPTDTLPLSPRAKLLMGLQAIEALLVSLLVIARAVSQLR